MKSISSMLLLVFILLGCQPNQNSTTPEKDISVEEVESDVHPEVTNEDASELENLTAITGIIRSSGLYERSIAQLNLTDGLYQITTTKKNYFVESKLNLSDIEGQCVRLKGNIVREAGAMEGAYDFERGTFEVLAYQQIQSTDCVGKISPSYEQMMESIKRMYGENPQPKSFKGNIVRSKRPAPDIAYDYKIVLEEPFVNPSDPRGDSSLTKELFITAKDNPTQQIFEAAITTGSAITLKGFLIGGFAESTIIYVVGLEK